MQKRLVLTAAVGAALLTACGNDPAPEPVEQIVVREPGAAEQSAQSDDAIALGKAAFAMCAACHVAEAGAASAAGPNLYGVVGRKAGALDDFAYSDAMASSGITWDNATLDRFLANPGATVPGTSMVAGAVRDGERRAAIVAYLDSLSE